MLKIKCNLEYEEIFYFVKKNKRNQKTNIFDTKFTVDSCFGKIGKPGSNQISFLSQNKKSKRLSHKETGFLLELSPKIKTVGFLRTL